MLQGNLTWPQWLLHQQNTAVTLRQMCYLVHLLIAQQAHVSVQKSKWMGVFGRSVAHIKKEINFTYAPFCSEDEDLQIVQLLSQT